MWYKLPNIRGVVGNLKERDHLGDPDKMGG